MELHGNNVVSRQNLHNFLKITRSLNNFKKKHGCIPRKILYRTLFYHNFSLLIVFRIEHGNFFILLSVAKETRPYIVLLARGIYRIFKNKLLNQNHLN